MILSSLTRVQKEVEAEEREEEVAERQIEGVTGVEDAKVEEVVVVVVESTEAEYSGEDVQQATETTTPDQRNFQMCGSMTCTMVHQHLKGHWEVAVQQLGHKENYTYLTWTLV